MRLGDGPRYGAVAMLLHWLIALLIVLAVTIGLSMADMPFSPRKLQYFSWHKWTGITVLGLAAVRLLWRLTHPAPPLPPGLAGWEARLAGPGHAGLYLLLFALPLTGWTYSSAKGISVVYLGLLPLPDLVAKDAALAPVLKQCHHTLFIALAVLVGLHVAAVLKHLFLDGHDVLHRMVPGGRRRH